MIHQSEIKEITLFLSGMPPWDIWKEKFRSLDPYVATNLSLRYIWLAKTYDAFFSDKPNPLPESGLDEKFQSMISEENRYYTKLSLVIFEAEPYLRKEAEELKNNLKEWKRSDMVKVWMLQECAHYIHIFSQNRWESVPPAHLKERAREYKKIFADKSSKEKIAILNARWEKEDEKLERSSKLSFESISPWIDFCIYVFVKYESKIPSIKDFWQEASKVKISHKFNIINGKYEQYPGRGKRKS